MASIYEKPPHLVLEKTWDKKNQATPDLQIAEQWFTEQNQGQSPPRHWKTLRQIHYRQHYPQVWKGGQENNYAHSFVEFENVLQE